MSTGRTEETTTLPSCRASTGANSTGGLCRVVALALLVILAAPIGSIASAELAAGNPTPPHGYRFGVFPYVPALTIDRIFGLVAAQFAQVLRQPVYLKTKPNFDKFAQELRNESYDIIFVHPFFYVDAADNHNYLPLARLDGELTAVALVAENRPWGDWSDLAGRTIALPPTLAAVSEMAKVALIEAGLTPGVDVTLRHYQTKVSCLRAVTVEAADACVLPEFALPQIEPMGEVKLRIMARTPPISHLIFAAHVRVPAAERQRLLRSILSWPDTAEGQAVLARGAWPRFVAAADGEYDQVRRYNTQLGTFAQR